MKIGYLGPVGTFSYYALVDHADKTLHGDELIATASISQLFSDFSAGRIDELFVPVENSIEGSVTSTMDLLATIDSAQIVDELIYPVNLALMIKEGDSATHIKEILSHPQPLGQCREYLSKTYPHADINVELSTAAAAKRVSDSSSTLAVVGHQGLAAQYGLTVLATNIQDHAKNFTRFIRVNKGSTRPTGQDKTSIVFSAQKSKSGSLVDILSLFSDADINLLRIVSRPTKVSLGEYLFFVDCEGHFLDTTLSQVLLAVSQRVTTYKCLGSYKKRGEVC
jgi:prephenate dehydratase